MEIDRMNAGRRHDDLAETAQMLRLVKAFGAVDDPAVRESVIVLVEALAGRRKRRH